MTITGLQMELRRRGVWVTLVDGGKLVCSPAGNLTPELRAGIKEHKAALLDEIELGWRQDWKAIEATL